MHRTVAVLGMWSLAVSFARASASAAILAGSAGDVCPPSADPCTVDEEIQIAPGSVLDFGQRTLRIETGGVLDFGDTPATVRCGKLEVDVEDAVAIRAAGSEDPGNDPSVRRLEVVRQCSAEPRDCFSEEDCDLGTCDVRVCQLAPSEQCFHDAMCNLGTCGNNGRCGFGQHPCDTNADCQVGPCGAQTVCRGSVGRGAGLFDRAEGPLACTTNADCELGDCTVGDGSIDLNGSTDLDLVYPHDFFMRAASDIAIRRPFEIAGSEGQVEIVSGLGDVDLEATVHSSGELGVFLFVQAGGDIVVDAPMDGSGAESGAQIGLFAGRDLIVSADVLARAAEQDGKAGQISLNGGQDVRIEDGTAVQPVTIHAGYLQHGPEKDDGRGGWLYVDAGRDALIDEHAHLRADGDDPNIGLGALRDFELHGAVTGTAFGSGRSAAKVSIYGERDVRLAPGSSIEIAGEEGAAAGSVTIHGRRDVDVEATLRFRGAVHEDFDAAQPPNVRVRGCMIHIGEDADLLNTADGSSNRIFAHGGLVFDGDASWICEDCPNTTKVRTSENPLTLAGTIDPPMNVDVAPDLEPCANCIDPSDDSRVLCDDGIACTTDICTDGTCSAVPDDTACDDSLFCNGVAFCSIEGGCQDGPAVDCSSLDDGCYVGTCDEDSESCVAMLVDGIACDDGDECTHSDVCTDAVCKGRRDVACGDCGNATIEWGEDCDDGDPDYSFGDLCTEDCRTAACGHPTGTAGHRPTASDALHVLRSAVGLAQCPLVLCDVNDSGNVEASDALLVLKSAVGLLSLSCPD